MFGILLVALGGAIGSASRYSVILLSEKLFSACFPMGTLIVNLIGCFIIGAVWAVIDHFDFPHNSKLFFMTGVLGGFTTFSSFALENFHMCRTGEMKFLAANLIVSNVAGILLVFVGYYAAKHISGFIK